MKILARSSLWYAVAIKITMNLLTVLAQIPLPARRTHADKTSLWKSITCGPSSTRLGEAGIQTFFTQLSCSRQQIKCKIKRKKLPHACSPASFIILVLLLKKSIKVNKIHKCQSWSYMSHTWLQSKLHLSLKIWTELGINSHNWKNKFRYLNKGWPTRWHLLHYILLNMFQTLIRPSSGAGEYLLCCVGWLEACWCYVAGLSVGDVVSECRFSLHSDTTSPTDNPAT